MSETMENLGRLIGFPTVSRDSNLALIDWYGGLLASWGARVETVLDASGTKANLFATIGPATGDGIVLSGHSDVVPVDGQAWSSDPFVMTLRDGRLHGRGTADMKGFLAAMLTAAHAASERRLVRPLHLLVSHDEEIGCVGVRSMLAHLARQGFRAAGCVVGEPTGMAVALGHKGKLAARIRCRGRAAHSANPLLGVNAIRLGAQMVDMVAAMQVDLASAGARDEAYEVPHSTAHVGIIAGGTALNIVPDHCAIDMEIRLVPPDDGALLLDDLRRRGLEIAAAIPPELADGTGIAIELLNAYPGLEIAEADPFVALVRAASGGNGTVKLSFGSEGGLIRRDLDMPVVVCGPGSIDRAHKPDEYITPDELAACDVFLARLLDRLV
jgi:acetylornithine deacetylase